MDSVLSTPLGAVQQLLFELNTDPLLQNAISSSKPDEILLLCQERGVYVNPELLNQFIGQLSAEESVDEELSLEQLEDVAGGLGVAVSWSRGQSLP